MYSLVLMTALTGTPDGPEFNGYFRNLFGGGCSGSSASPGGCSGSSSSAAGCTGYSAPRYSCNGGGCSGSASAASGGCTGSGYGCTGSSSASSGCNGGCSGGGLFGGGGFGTRVRRLFDRGGCSGTGGCSGSGSGYGCSGSGYGCSGSAYSCFGGPAVAYTPVFNGGLSCQGGLPMSAPPPVFDPYPSYPAQPRVAPPPTSIPYAPPEAAPGPNPQNTGLRPAGLSQPTLVGSGNPSARATVIVRLPADARLFAESRPLNLTGAERKFVSPELPGGQEFTYRFRVEYERDGETVSVTKKVPVRAGSSATIEFTDLTAKTATPEKNAGGTAPVATTTSNTGGAVVPSVAPATPTAAVPTIPAVPTPTASGEDRATITVRLPVGAVLYVDDRRSPSADPVRRFNTPPLPNGREFAYLIRAEVVRNGQTETFTQKVPFRAGERVEVDFTGVGR